MSYLDNTGLSVVWGKVKALVNSKADSTHSHGAITNSGDITEASPTIASGDKLIINDESSSKITNGPSFGSSNTTYLRNDGTWGTPSGTYELPVATDSVLGGVTSGLGLSGGGDAVFVASDGKLFPKGSLLSLTEDNLVCTIDEYLSSETSGDTSVEHVSTVVLDYAGADSISNSFGVGENSTAAIEAGMRAWYNTSEFEFDTSILGHHVNIITSNNVTVNSIPIPTMQSTTATLSSSGWSNNQNTVNVAGVTSSNNVIVSPADASVSLWAIFGVYCSSQGSGTLTFRCATTPSSNLTANILILS